jgi:hypothetical protein
MNSALRLTAIGVAVALGGCSTVMEAQRPPATNLNKFAFGEKRLDVVAQVGPALSTVQDGDSSCDIYKLYTSGTSKVGKGAIIFTEAAADVFTAGLAEAVLTPGEAMSKSKQHSVFFCYDKDSKLLTIKDSGKPVTLLK